jgi:GH25 family lysozyme M1 (1,4-beta-N-acetylmuramidase)
MIPAGCIEIIDVSSVQQKIDFDAVVAWVGPDGERVEGIIAKASEGNADRPDAQFTRNWQETKRIGKPRGRYRFGHPDMMHVRDAQDEAERCVRLVETAGGFTAGLDFAALDIEEARNIPMGERFVRWIVEGCERTDELTGSREGVYCGGPFFTEHAGKAVSPELLARLQRRWHWLAAYVGDPTRFIATPWHDDGFRIWQESGDVAPPGQTLLHVGGIGGGRINVDRDFFRGTAADLRAWISSLVIAPIAPVTQPPIDPRTVLQHGGSTLADNIHDLTLLGEDFEGEDDA